MKERIVILGAGESGVGAAILAKNKNYDVFVSDFGSIKDQFRSELIAQNIAFEEGMHTDALILNANLIVKSPGIPDKAAIVQKIKAQNITILAEIEFAYQYAKGKTICITGSNGKTTTTTMAYDLLKRAGLDVVMAGNIGKSLARIVAEQDHDYYVIELSSFQLDNMYSFKANIAVLMNITPDHLDRYDYKMQNYIDSKFRIVQNQTADDAFIYFADDEIIAREVQNRNIPSIQLPFTLSDKLNADGAKLIDGSINIQFNHKTFEMSIYDLALQGKHNTCNSMAAAIIGKVAGIRNEFIRECLSDFRGVEHRLERYLTVHGIDFINDSKATNINSAWYALESMTKPVVWIVGGVDKGNDYNELMDLVKTKVKAIVCLGKDNTKIVKTFEGVVSDIVETQSMAHAVKSAYFLSEPNNVVLLSPACASFDLFENYEDRGQQFKDAVRNL